MKALRSSGDSGRREQGLRQKIVRGGMGSICIKALYVVIQFLIGVTLARVMGPEMLGVYAFAMSLVHLISVLAQFGFPRYLVRAVAMAKANDDNLAIRSLTVGSIRVVTSISVILVVLVYAALVLWNSRISDELVSVLLIGMVLVPMFALSATMSGAVQGAGHVLIAQVPEQLVRPAVFLFGIMLTVWLGYSLTPGRSLMLHLVSSIVALAGGITAIRVYLRPYATANSPIQSTSSLMRQSAPFLLLAGAQIVTHQTDILMLGLLAGDEDVGHYRVAVQVSDALTLLLFAIGIAISPHIAGMHAKSDWRGIQRLLVVSHRVGVAAILPFAVALVVVGGAVIEFVFGSAFRPAAAPLAILAVGYVGYATIGFSGLALSMLGRVDAAAVITLFTAVFNVILNALLIPRFGIQGAAAATALSALAISSIGMLWMWRTYARNFSAFALGTSSSRSIE